MATITSKRNPHNCRPHPRSTQHKGGLVVQSTRSKELQVGHKGVSPGLQALPFPASSGSFRKQVEQTNEMVLFLAPRWLQNQSWQCMGRTMEQASMAQSTLGIDLASFEEVQPTTSPSGGPCVPANVEDGGVVAPTRKDDGCHTPHSAGCPNLFRSSRKQDAFPEMGNPFHGYPAMQQWEFKKALRKLESQHDIPHQKRLEWLNNLARSTTPQRQVWVQSAIKRVKSQSKKPKNVVMPDIKELITKAFNATWPNDDLTQILLVQIRLQTMMRSVDASQLVNGYFTYNGKVFIKTTTKSGQPRIFNIVPPTIAWLNRYLDKYKDYPAQYLFRSTKCPHLCLGSERLAKLAKQFMQQCHINTDVFTSHALRGAVATHLLAQGVDIHQIQERGG